MRNPKALVVITLFSVVILAEMSFAYPVANFDSGDLMQSSDVVCRVKVASIKTNGTYVDENFHPAVESPKLAARVSVISIIKGNPSKSITIDFPEGAMMVSYTRLVKGEYYIVFLKGERSPYQFTDPHNGAIGTKKALLVANLGDKPADKILAELEAAVTATINNKQQKFLIEQIGKLKDNRASKFLQRMSTSDIMPVKSAALVARINVGDAPKPDELLSILKLDPSEYPSKQIEMYRGNSKEPKIALSWQSDITRAIESSVVEKGSEMVGGKMVRRPPEALKGFDYFGFVKESLECKVIKENDILRSNLVSALRSLADPKSIPLLLELLDDQSQIVRYLAATSFAAITGKNGYFVSTDLFNADESKYINYWKEWAANNMELR